MAATCAPRSIEVTPSHGEPGAHVTVVGQHFTTCPPLDCEDFDCQPSDLFRPETGVVISFVQGGRTWELATVDADEDMRIHAAVSVPADASAGAASFEVRHPRIAEPQTAPFTVEAPAPPPADVVPATHSAPPLPATGPSSTSGFPLALLAAAWAVRHVIRLRSALRP